MLPGDLLKFGWSGSKRAFLLDYWGDAGALPNKSPQPTALSWRFARRVELAAVIFSGGVLPEPGGGWAPGR